MAFKDYLMGLEYTGINVKGLSSQELLELFKDYEAHSISNGIKEAIDGQEQSGKTNTDDMPQMPSFLQEHAKKKTKVINDSLKPKQDSAVSEPTAAAVAEESQKEFPEEQRIAFEKIKALIKIHPIFSLSPESTPLRLSLFMDIKGGAWHMQTYNAVTCLDRLERQIAHSKRNGISTGEIANEKA